LASNPFSAEESAEPGRKARHLEIPISTLRSNLSRLRARDAQLLREEVVRTIGKVDDVDKGPRHSAEY
jgi:hypothetical protein